MAALEARLYCSKLRNPVKRRYAFDVWKALQHNADCLPSAASTGLTFMAGQAVRNALLACYPEYRGMQ